MRKPVILRQQTHKREDFGIDLSTRRFTQAPHNGGSKPSAPAHKNEPSWEKSRLIISVWVPHNSGCQNHEKTQHIELLSGTCDGAVWWLFLSNAMLALRMALPHNGRIMF